MNRFFAALALSLSLASSSVALAAPAQKPAAARHQGKGDHDKKFPMKADEFRQHVAGRVTKAREHMEKRISTRNVPEEKAKEIRAKFNAGVAALNQKVEAVCADGTVTKEEAKEVHALVHQMVQHHKHGKKDKKLPGPMTCSPSAGRSDLGGRPGRPVLAPGAQAPPPTAREAGSPDSPRLPRCWPDPRFPVSRPPLLIRLNRLPASPKLPVPEIRGTYTCSQKPGATYGGFR